MGGGGRNEESPQPLLRQIRTKLFTREDNTNIHKTLGVTCLLSYLWHFVRVGEGDMGFTNTYSTPMVIALHLLLSVSSIIFRIPAKRIVSGYRIWPEYRLHSIMFACRSLACMLLTWVEAQQGWAPEYRANAVICLATIAAADLSSYMVGPAGRSSTIRDLEAGPATHFFFSAMQFHATMGCMLGVRRYSTQFIYVWIIQFNAFLMTLRRKNLAGHTALVTTYGFMLAFGYMVATYEQRRVGLFLVANFLGNVAGFLRIGLGVPKYPLWVGMAVLTHYSRISTEGPDAEAVPWLALYVGSTVALLCVGARKILKAGDKVPRADASGEGDGLKVKGS